MHHTRRPLPDPFRIAPTLEHLRNAWEAQPFITLPALLTQLQHLGAHAAATDADFTAAATLLSRLHPVSLSAVVPSQAVSRPVSEPDATLPESIPGPVVISLLEPARRATLLPNGTCVIIDSMPGIQPTWWRISRIMQATAGQPLVLADESGVAHRLGLIERMTVLPAVWELFGDPLATLQEGNAGAATDGGAASAATLLNGLRRDTLLNAGSGGGGWMSGLDAGTNPAFLVVCEDQSVLHIHRYIDAWTIGRRSLRHTRMNTWACVTSAAIGAPLSIDGEQVFPSPIVDVWRIA